MVVSDGQDVDDVICHEVGDVIRKSTHWRAPHVEVRWKPLDDSPGSGPLRDGLDRGIDRSQEREAEAMSSILVPARRVGEFRRRFRPETDRKRHPLK